MAKKTVDPDKQIDPKALFDAVQNLNADLAIPYIGMPDQAEIMHNNYARQLPNTIAIVNAAALTFDAEVAQLREAGHKVNPLNPFKSNKAPIFNRLEKAITKAAGKARFK